MSKEDWSSLLSRIQRCSVAIQTLKNRQRGLNYDDPMLVAQSDMDYIDKTLEIAFNAIRKEHNAKEKTIEYLDEIADYFARNPAEEDNEWNIEHDAIAMCCDIIDWLKGYEVKCLQD